MTAVGTVAVKTVVMVKLNDVTLHRDLYGFMLRVSLSVTALVRVGFDRVTVGNDVVFDRSLSLREAVRNAVGDTLTLLDGGLRLIDQLLRDTLRVVVPPVALALPAFDVDRVGERRVRVRDVLTLSLAVGSHVVTLTRTWSVSAVDEFAASMERTIGRLLTTLHLAIIVIPAAGKIISEGAYSSSTNSWSRVPAGRAVSPSLKLLLMKVMTTD